MRVPSPSDQALIQAQWRLDMQGHRPAIARAAGDGNRQDHRTTLPEVRIYEGEYVAGEAVRNYGSHSHTHARAGVFDASAGYGQTGTETHRATPQGVLRYLEQQPPEPEIAPVGRGRLGQHLDVYV